MSIQLVVEVLEKRPATLGDKETVMLLAIAENARDNTRIGMPGHDVLALRGQCTERTVRRRIEALIKAGMIQEVVKAAPGRRAHYKILPMPEAPVDNSVTADTYLSAVDPVDNSPTPDTYLSGDNESTSDKRSSNGGHLPVRRSGSNGGHLPVHLALKEPKPSLVGPQIPNGSPVNSPVEGSAPAPEQDQISASRSRWTDPVLIARQQAAEARERRERQEAQCQ